MLKFKIISVLGVFIYCTILYAELSPNEFTFSTLFSKSEIIAKGKVKDVKINNYEYQMNFEIHDDIKESGYSQTIDVVSPLVNGFYRPDDSYLEIENEYVLFLYQDNGKWHTVHGISGVFKAKLVDDVHRIFDAYQKNGDSLSKDLLKNLFFTVTHDEIKTRFLYELKKQISESDIEFLKTLLESDNKHERIFSILELGKLKISSMRLKIE